MGHSRGQDWAGTAAAVNGVTLAVDGVTLGAWLRAGDISVSLLCAGEKGTLPL